MGNMDICVSGRPYRSETCVICLARPKRPKIGGEVHIVLDFKIVTLMAERWIAPEVERVCQVSKEDKGLVVVPHVRVGGTICLKCARTLASRLDAAIEACAAGRYSR
jgi:hypothetical protein